MSLLHSSGSHKSALKVPFNASYHNFVVTHQIRWIHKKRKELTTVVREELLRSAREELTRSVVREELTRSDKRRAYKIS